MCDSKGTRFFRPWNIAEPINSETTTIGTAEETQANPAYIKVEEDNESILSISTCEESSAASFSENETSRGSISERRRRRRRRSESSADTSTRSCSVNSEDHVEGNSLDMLSNFVFNSQPTSDYPVAPIAREPPAEDTQFNSNMDYRTVAPAYPMDYLQRMAMQRTNGFPPLVDGSSCFMASNVEYKPLEASTVSNISQNLYYGFPGMHQFPQSLYASSMEEAVELIHRQDAVAKQMKKLRPKKFRCEHCDVAFSNNGQLKGHIRIHTGERPFKCDAEGCGKSFTRNEELTRHKRIHTGLRPHSCVLCGKRFGRKDHLKKHTRTHDSRDPYRVSAAALGVFAMRQTIPHTHPLPPYVYPI